MPQETVKRAAKLLVKAKVAGDTLGDETAVAGGGPAPAIGLNYSEEDNSMYFILLMY